jgi:hypothetical protein
MATKFTQLTNVTVSAKINLDQLEFELKNYPDRFFVNYLLNSFRFDFDMLVSITDIPTYECRNALSARNNPGIVTRLLQEEIDKGFIRGPFSKPPFKQQNWSQEQLPPVSEFLLMRFIAFCETQMHLKR